MLHYFPKILHLKSLASNEEGLCGTAQHLVLYAKPPNTSDNRAKTVSYFRASEVKAQIAIQREGFLLVCRVNFQ